MEGNNRTVNTGVKGSDTSAGELEGKKHTRTRTTKNGGTGNGTGTPDNNNGTGTGTPKEKESSGLALVNPEETIPAPELKKPRKPRTTKKKTVKKNDECFNAEQITALLLTASSIASMSERGRIFALSEIEARQLAEPLAKIIANNDSLKSFTEHSDSVALGITAFMIFAPKFFVWLQYEKAHRKPKGGDVKIAKGVKPVERKTDGSIGNANGGTVTGSSGNNANDDEDINALIPSIM